MLPCGDNTQRQLRSGEILQRSSPAPAIVPTTTPADIKPFVVQAIDSVTPAPTVPEAFVTQETAPLTDYTPTPTANTRTILYYAQSGDWLPAVAIRFGVDANAIASPKILPEKGLLDSGTLLIIPDTLDRSLPFTSALQLIPDNELIFSSTALDFKYCNVCERGWRIYLLVS